MTNQAIYCGKINKKYLNKTVHFYGWIKNIRKLGGLIFIEVIDRYGFIQIVSNDKHPDHDQMYHTPIQSVVYVTGVVKKRKSINTKIPNGDIEVIVKSYEITSPATVLPIPVDDETIPANENLRLTYRYLDIRRPSVQQNLIFRAKLIQTIRNFLNKLDFIEVETPNLSKATPEGARDYLVPTRNCPNSFFALPQSPQIYKQLLMIGGILKYFQIARCFRDEDLRADRQPEFTQLDIEMSFIEEKDIQNLIEKLMVEIFRKCLNIKLKVPFKHLSYDYAMNHYGSDKPDLRFGLELYQANDAFTTTQFKIFQNAIKQKQNIKYIITKEVLTNEQINILRKYAKDNKAYDLIALTFKNKQLGGTLKNVIEQSLIAQIFKKHQYQQGTILLIAGELDIVNQALGAVRNQLATLLNLKDPHQYCFCWIDEWPLYEYSEIEKRYVAAHHPFTSPAPDCLDTFDKDFKNAKARAYDIVLNGYEIGGGSIRISNEKIQQRMFTALGLTRSQIDEKFGFMINAFKYGTPIHGGIALGLDRFIMLLTNTNTIRDIIAFPKDSHNIDQMMKSPASVSPNQLDELFLSIKTKK